MQDPRLSVSLASISLAALAGAQGSAFSPCLLERGKELLLGPAGLPAREHGRLGPCGDVDGDGDVDLLWEARTLLNDGSGTFRRSVPSGVPGGEALGLFDADGDGVLDLLLRDELRLGDGSGRFFAASAALPADFVADTALFRDVDGDRTVDLLALERRDWPAPAHVRICLNDGSGHFGEVTHPVAPDDTQVLAAGDVDADGDVDLFLAGESSVELWRNDGAGVFTTDPAAIPAALGRVQAVAPADLNGDLALDLALGLDGTDGTPDATWLENDGTGAFTLRSLPAASTHRRSSVVIALDVEGDGDTDLLCAADAQVLLLSYPIWFEAPARLLLNEGKGAFVASDAFPPARGLPNGGFAADLDGDKDTDVVLVDGTYPHRFLLNDGNGAFLETRSATHVLSELHDRRTRTVALGDLDGDGLPDVFTPRAILLNGPPGVLRALSDPLPELPAHFLDVYHHAQAREVALGDIDGDGDLDAYLISVLPDFGPLQKNRLWINDGLAGFIDETVPRLPEGEQEAVGNPHTVALLELDGDGDIDAICLRSRDTDGSGSSSAYRNDGTGTFARIGALGAQNYAGALGDLDGDGDADFLEGAVEYRFGNRVHWNDGTAAFTLDSAALPPHEETTAEFVLLKDLDGNGELDAVVRVHGSPARRTLVYVNGGDGTFAEESERLPLEGGGWWIDAADLDVDGHDDLVTSLSIWLNDGTGRFREVSRNERPWMFGAHGGDAAFADMDLDGDPDLVMVDVARTHTASGLARHLELLGAARVGQHMSLQVHGPPRTPFALLESTGTLRVSLGTAGWLLIDPARLISVSTGFLDGRGRATHVRAVPPDPALVGARAYWQAFVGCPAHSTNLLVTDLGDE